MDALTAVSPGPSLGHPPNHLLTALGAPLPDPSSHQEAPRTMNGAPTTKLHHRPWENGRLRHIQIAAHYSTGGGAAGARDERAASGHPKEEMG